jgi:hypothetical protein
MGTSLDFDPLSDWLGIAVEERPPTHYALLGLERHETSQDRIQEAYLRRYQAVRRYEVGPRQEAAVQILEELSRAFLILSNTERKQVYDQALPISALVVVAGPSDDAAAATDDVPVVGILETVCPNPQCIAPFLLQPEWAGAQANCKTDLLP